MQRATHQKLYKVFTLSDNHLMIMINFTSGQVQAQPMSKLERLVCHNHFSKYEFIIIKVTILYKCANFNLIS
jgi:hypothetical protein